MTRTTTTTTIRTMQLEQAMKSEPISVKLMIFGGRDFKDKALMKYHIQSVMAQCPGVDVEIVSGMARGADRIAYNLAKEMGLEVHEFPADWENFGKRAGYLRNTQMAEYCDYAIAYWDGKSNGTKHNIGEMKRLGKTCKVIKY